MKYEKVNRIAKKIKRWAKKERERETKRRSEIEQESSLADWFAYLSKASYCSLRAIQSAIYQPTPSSSPPLSHTHTQTHTHTRTRNLALSLPVFAFPTLLWFGVYMFVMNTHMTEKRGKAWNKKWSVSK